MPATRKELVEWVEKVRATRSRSEHSPFIITPSSHPSRFSFCPSVRVGVFVRIPVVTSTRQTWISSHMPILCSLLQRLAFTMDSRKRAGVPASRKELAEWVEKVGVDFVLIRESLRESNHH